MPFYTPALWGEVTWVEEILDVADGIVLTGGGDVVPRSYAASSSIALQRPLPLRDMIETRLVLEAAALRVPVLGICRGTQLINVAFGGSLVPDVPTARPSNIRHSIEPDPDREHHPVHDVILERGSKLARAYGTDRVSVNSMHHQAVDDAGTGVQVVGVAPDGLTEGIELSEGWVVGVQWHPERMIEAHPEHLSLFEALVRVAAATRRVTQ